MPDSDITVSGLVATPGIGHIALQWSYDDPNVDGLPYLALDQVEVWAAASNDRSLAAKVAEGRTNALHVALVEGATWFYWIKARNRSGRYGDWHPSSAAAGVQTTVGYAASAAYALINGKLVASIASNALTVAIKTLSGGDPSALDPVLCAFRNADLSEGAPEIRRITSAVSLTVPSGAYFAADDVPFRLWCCLFNDGGVYRLALKNCQVESFVLPLAEYGLGSSTVIAVGACGAGIFFGSGAVSEKPFRIVGYLEWESGLPTQGVYSVEPSQIQLFSPGVKKPGDLVAVHQQSFGLVLYNGSPISIPMDGTNPQSTDGVTVASVTMTPTSSVNSLRVAAECNVAKLTAGQLVMALFRSDQSGQIGIAVASVGADQLHTLSKSVVVPALTAAQLTFSANVGAGTSAEISVNAPYSGASPFGSGQLSNRITVEEFMA